MAKLPFSLPKEATVPLPPMPKIQDIPVEVVKYIPKRHDDPVDREAMSRAAQAYESLQYTLGQMREQLERQREEISHQRNRIDLLEHSLLEAKNVANEYRTECDEAKAKTASWEVFFANIQTIFNKYKLPDGTPQRLPEPEPPADLV